ncbi:hypothetical protein FA15DRAFT_727244 [Coprinopsis marcescibilis]|uniref:Uncharacterized protein n=1 Tax=Coprinopsis marcescibilis TaxID=230819 RepID=A0A5C3L3Q6_COPMA|nr:hypothetical protein FA15DRAFT_727244 [Coprinopsis marcescibilis]
MAGLELNDDATVTLKPQLHISHLEERHCAFKIKESHRMDDSTIRLADHDDTSLPPDTPDLLLNPRYGRLPVELVYEVLDEIFTSAPSIHTKRCCELGEHLHSDPPDTLVLDESLGYYVHCFSWRDVVNCSLVSRAVRGYTLPQLFHRVKVTSAKEFVGLYHQLLSLVVVPTTCDSGVRMVKSLSILCDCAPVLERISGGRLGHPISDIVASLSEISLDLFNSSIVPSRKLAFRRPPGQFDIEEMMSRGEAKEWGLSIPLTLQHLTEVAAAKEPPNSLRSLSIHEVRFPWNTLNRLLSPHLLYLEVFQEYSLIPQLSGVPDYIDLSTHHLQAPWTVGKRPGDFKRGTPMPTVPYALRVRRTDARERYGEYDLQYLVSGEHTGIMPYRILLPHLHTIEIEVPDSRFGADNPFGASKFVEVLAGMAFKAPELSCIRLPVIACKHSRILCQPVIAPFKRVELVHDLSARHLQDADIASWVLPPLHTIHTLDKLETLVISFVNGGFPRPEHPASIFDPDTDPTHGVVLGGLGPHSIHENLIYPDVESLLADFRGALAWEKFVGWVQDPHMSDVCPNWRRLVLDLTQLKRIHSQEQA